MDPTLKSSSKVNLVFKAGDVIQDFCEPFMKTLKLTVKGSRCDYCFEAGTKLRRCTGCKQVFYCGKTCQISDWKVAHKVECSLTYFHSTFPVPVPSLTTNPSSNRTLVSSSSTTESNSTKSSKGIENNMDLTGSSRSNENTEQKHGSSIFTASTIEFKYRLLRLFACLKLHPEIADQPYKLYDGTFRCFNDLMSHQDAVEQNGTFRKYCRDISSHIIKEGSLGLNETDREPLFQYFLRLSGIVRTNAFCIWTLDKTEQIGTGIYIETSIFDHSCKPTAFFLTKGTSMQIRAIGPTPKHEKPLISYILAHCSREERQKILRERYNFNCQCERCEEEEDSGKDPVDIKQLVTLVESTSKWNLEKDEHGVQILTDWKEILKVHNEIIESFRCIYYEYDERITNQLFWTWNKLIEIEKATFSGNSGSCPPQKALMGLTKEVKDHLRTTYGQDHIYFQQFKELSPFSV